MATRSDSGRERPRVLVIDDDRSVVELLVILVEEAGFVPVRAYEPIEALALFEQQTPSLVLLDLRLKPWDGFDVLAELRRRSATVPIVVLTAVATEDDKVRALEAGADDYVLKPFGHRELVARIRTQVRRAHLGAQLANGPTVIDVGSLRLNIAERLLEIAGEEQVRLTGTESRLLEYLMRNYPVVIAAEKVAKDVWGYNDGPAREVVRVTVHRLRKKLGEDGERRRFIETVPGVGLALRPTLDEQVTERPM